MKKHALRKAIPALILVIVMLLTTSTALAKGIAQPPETVSPRYTGIKGLIVSLTVSDTGRATCKAEAAAYSPYTVTVTAELQEANGNWETIKSWSSGGTSTVTINQSYYVSTSYSHRVKATAYVYDSGGNLVESVVEYSDIV